MRLMHCSRLCLRSLFMMMVLAGTVSVAWPPQSLTLDESSITVAASHSQAARERVAEVACTGIDDTAALSLAAASSNGGWVIISRQQTCAGRDLTIPNLRIESGGLLKPLTAHTITLKNFEAGNYQVFSNALPGQGSIQFSEGAPGPIIPLWWANNTTPGTTDMTAAVQAAFNATGGRGRVHLPEGGYLITSTLRVPTLTGRFSPIVFDGAGPFLSNLVNRAAAGNPTMLIDRDLITVRNLGFFGDEDYPNNGIKVSKAGRIYIDGNKFFVKGSAIYLEQAQSIFIQNNYGGVSDGSALPPPGVKRRLASFGPTDSFVYVNIPNGGFTNHIVIRDNMNENYSYQVYTSQSGNGHGNSWVIDGNQFEGAASGIKLDFINAFEISGNYMGEGGAGYTIDLNNCRDGRVGPNYLHFVDADSPVNTIKLNDTISTLLMGSFYRLFMTGRSFGNVAMGTSIDRIQDETTDHQMSFINSRLSDIAIPLGSLNSQTGRAVWYADTTETTFYPTVRSGDQVLLLNPSAGTGTGWLAITGSSAGPLTRVNGRGPGPVVLGDYADPVAYDFRLTVLKSGPTGSATFKVEWKPAGAGSYADLTKPTVTTELAHLVKRELKDGPVVSFAVRWPRAGNYVTGDQWVLNKVQAPVWKVIP
jgi:Pectate lyase superfamily protein